MIRINDEAPDFSAETTQGTINFHQWIGNGWSIFFPIRKTLLRFAPPSSATWPVWRPNSRSGTARLSG